MYLGVSRPLEPHRRHAYRYVALSLTRIWQSAGVKTSPKTRVCEKQFPPCSARVGDIERGVLLVRTIVCECGCTEEDLGQDLWWKGETEIAYKRQATRRYRT